MTEEFGGDVLLYNTDDGGEIDIENGLVISDGGFKTAVLLSLYGGNKNDTGEVDSDDSWWGNRLEGVTEEEKLVSRFASFIRAVPLSSSNIKIAEDKVMEDLKWFVDDGIADSVAVSINEIGNGRVSVQIEIDKSGKVIESGSYAIQWEAMKNNGV